MNARLDVFALPSLLAPDDLAGATAVVIDVLRASTTICQALTAGADAVIPLAKVAEVRSRRAAAEPGSAIAGGERDGLPIPGFDLGNSPQDYTADVVAGKTIFFTTTNGTRALLAARSAASVLVGAFANVSQLLTLLLTQERIALVCAGTENQFGRDDVLLAGLLVQRLQQQSGDRYALNAQATTARENWMNSFPLPMAIGAEPLPAERLAAELARSIGGVRLTELGLEADILAAAQLDATPVVPRLDDRGRLVVG